MWTYQKFKELKDTYVKQVTSSNLSQVTQTSPYRYSVSGQSI